MAEKPLGFLMCGAVNPFDIAVEIDLETRSMCSCKSCQTLFAFNFNFGKQTNYKASSNCCYWLPLKESV